MWDIFEIAFALLALLMASFYVNSMLPHGWMLMPLITVVWWSWFRGKCRE